MINITTIFDNVELFSKLFDNFDTGIKRFILSINTKLSKVNPIYQKATFNDV